MLWNQLDTERREQHISCVELFYRLHCLAPSSSICEDIICQALLHKDKVTKSLLTCFTHHLTVQVKYINRKYHRFRRKVTGVSFVCLPQGVRLEALHRFTILWHLMREIQNNRSMSLDRSFDRLVNISLCWRALFCT